MVTAVTSTTITISSTFAGSNPANGTYNLRVGGAWAGPTGSTVFPGSLASLANLRDNNSDPVRVNFKNDQTYSITAAYSWNSTGAHQGYTTTFNDGGRATLDGGTSGASYTLFSSNGAIFRIKNFILQNNGLTGSASGLSFSGNSILEDVIIKGMRGHGVTYGTNQGHLLISCEVYNNNLSNTSSLAGINTNVTIGLHQCVVHDNPGSNTSGLLIATTSSLIVVNECIFDSNGSHGINNGSAQMSITNSIFYGNGGKGLNVGTSALIIDIDNSIFESNTSVGVGGSSLVNTETRLRNCGFYGNSAATSGIIDDTGTITGSASFFNDAANGDFSTVSAAQAVGVASFPETVNYSKSTASYPDIGVAQHQSTSGGMILSRVFTGQ